MKRQFGIVFLTQFLNRLLGLGLFIIAGSIVISGIGFSAEEDAVKAAPQLVLFSDGAGLYTLNPVNGSSQRIGPDGVVEDEYLTTSIHEMDSADQLPKSVLITVGYGFYGGLESSSQDRLVYVETSCIEVLDCPSTARYNVWLFTPATGQRTLILDEVDVTQKLSTPHPFVLRPLAWNEENETIFFEAVGFTLETRYGGIWQYQVDTGDIRKVDLGIGGYNGRIWPSPDSKFLLTTGPSTIPVGEPLDQFGIPDTSVIKLIDTATGSVRVLANEPVEQDYYYVRGWIDSRQIDSLTNRSRTEPSAIDAVPEATSGFQRPFNNAIYGYEWLQWTGEVYHPGDDYNGPGGGNTDCNSDIFAVANGEVRYVNTGSWGGIVIQHLWQGITVYSQYGHVSTALVSTNQQVTKGQHIAEMGNVGTTYCHLHWEIREADHPNPTNGAYWSNLGVQSNVENWYEDPEWWSDNHGSYGTCSAPSLNSPSDGATLTNRYVTFSWNAATGCAVDGYTFRVCTSSDVNNLSNCQGTGLMDRGVGGTSYSYEITGRDNTDLWWGVRALYQGTPVSTWNTRRFRIQPETPCPQSGGVILYWNGNYNCNNDQGDAGYRQRTGTGWQNVNDGSFNDKASSVKVPSGWSVKLFANADRGEPSVCFNGDISDFGTQGNFPGSGTAINDNVSSMEVFSSSGCGGAPGIPSLSSPVNGAAFNRNTSITLSWNTASNASSYYAEMWGGPNASYNSGWTSGTSWAVGQPWGGSYQWRVKARNSAGTESGWSETRSFTVKYGSPSGLTATAASGSQINLSWNASADAPGNIDGYRIYRGGSAIATVGSSTTSYQNTGLSCGTDYSYTVKAYKGSVESDASNTASATTAQCLPDLVPYAPSGYAYPVVPSSIEATTEVGSLYAGKRVFFDWHFRNAGGGTAVNNFTVRLLVGQQMYVDYPHDNFGAGSIGGFDDWGETHSQPGCQIVRLIVDPDNTVAESNENNNTWEREFCWLTVSGWWGEYFNNETLSGNPALVRDDPAINFEWEYDSPGPGINPDPFSVRWTREMNFEAGTYDFSLTHDDGISFWIDDTLVLNEWGTCCRTDQVTWSLTAGNHHLRVEMFDHYGVATAQLSWVRRAVSNDDFNSPLVIPDVVYMNNQSTADATTAADDPVFTCGSQDQGSASVWYRFTPTNNGVLTVSTEGSNYDTMVAVWSGARGSLSSIGCNDDAGGSTTSQLSVPLVANNTYYLEIADYGYEGAAMFAKARQLEGITAVNGGGSLSLALEYVTPRPDLVVESITFSPTNPIVGQDVDITVRIRNNGNNALTNAVWLWHYIDHQPTGCGDDELTFLWMVEAGLAVGAYREFTATYSDFTSGQHTMWAFVDSDCWVAESDDSNNIGGPVTISVAESGASADLFISSAGNTTVGGMPVTNADILSYSKPTNTWNVLYDGSYIGTAKNVGAFAFDGDDILLGFSAAQVVPGLGTAAAQDLVRFSPTSLGYNNTAGSFAWFFDGSDVGLTTAAEAIDALWIDAAGRLYISTGGTAKVNGPTGAVITAQDEDVLRFTPTGTGVNTAGMWELYWNPTSITGMSAEDINGYWEDPATGYRYVTILGAFNVGNTAYGGKFAGDGKTILRFAPNVAAPGGWAPAEKLTWLAAGATFPSTIDGIEMTR